MSSGNSSYSAPVIEVEQPAPTRAFDNRVAAPGNMPLRMENVGEVRVSLLPGERVIRAGQPLCFD